MIAASLVIAGLVLTGVMLRELHPDREAARRGGPAAKPVVTVSGLTILAAQIERLHVLNGAGLLSDADLKRAEYALLDAVPEI